MENNFPPILSADEARTEERRPAVSFLRSKRMRNREGGGMRSVISIGASSSESSAWYLRAYRRVFRGWYRGRGLGGRGGGAARGKGLLPRPLDRYTAITRRRIDPTTRRLTVRRIPRWNNPLFPPRSGHPFVSRRRKSHGEGPPPRRRDCYIREIIIVDDVVVYVLGWMEKKSGKYAIILSL